ncbi:MAG: shikimate dehydrogenase [Silicimonas sp.]|nr:shikimate dehydrogenase [Silicimonas sp.]RZW00313.1 MAG: shikimate dehydrogenase [Paracoccaceae bacterium]
MEFLSALTGSFSHPAAGNPTVAMVEAAYRHHDLDFRYINCDVAEDDLEDAVRGARAMGWRGFNLSIPHKIAVIDHIDSLAESAAIIGAVNCVRRDQDRLVGENTDGKGFVQSLDGIVGIPGTRVVVLGAGGAARAIAVELALAGADQVTLINRTAAKAEAIAALVSTHTSAEGVVRSWSEPLQIPEGTDVLVNATSIGLYPNGGMPPVDFSSLNPATLVADVIVNPRDTPFLAEANARGCKTIDGHGMLVNQAIIGVAHWTGVHVDGAVMRSTLASIFG